MGVDITGLTELKAKFDDLSSNAKDRAVRKALQAGAEIEKAAIEYRAPERVDLPSGTALPQGALRADITVKIKRSDQGNLHAVIEPGDLTHHVALWVEEGHRLVRGGYSKEIYRHGEATGKFRGPGTEIATVEAHPFVRPAFEETRTEVEQAIATTLSQEIEKASKAK
jgi:HK97 gp10 family phage protein